LKSLLPESVETLEQAVTYVRQFKGWQPFKWSGKWFLVKANAGVYAYRSMQSVRTRLERDGIATADVVTVK
jgi:hypothetical protein